MRGVTRVTPMVTRYQALNMAQSESLAASTKHYSAVCPFTVTASTKQLTSTLRYACTNYPLLSLAILHRLPLRSQYPSPPTDDNHIRLVANRRCLCWPGALPEPSDVAHLQHDHLRGGSRTQLRPPITLTHDERYRPPPLYHLVAQGDLARRVTQMLLLNVLLALCGKPELLRILHKLPHLRWFQCPHRCRSSHSMPSQ